MKSSSIKGFVQLKLKNDFYFAKRFPRFWGTALIKAI